MIATDRVNILIGKLTNRIVPRKAPIPPPNANETVKKEGKQFFENYKVGRYLLINQELP